MPAGAIVMLALGIVFVLALASYLLRVIASLRSIIDLLGKITFGVRAIAFQTKPVNELMGEIGQEAATIDGVLNSLLEAKTRAHQEAL
jgi:hypothetical protein